MRQFEPEYGGTLDLDVSTTSADEEFAGSGNSILIYNAHDQIVWVKTGPQVGNPAELVATALVDLPIPPGRQTLIFRPRTHTHIAAVAASGAGKLYVTQGSGN